MPLVVQKITDPNVIQAGAAILGTDMTTTSTTYGDLLTLTMTLAGSTNLLIWANFTTTFSVAVANNARFRLVVDGVNVLYCGTEEFTIAESSSMVYRATGLAAGSRIVKIQWRIGTAGEGTLRCRPSVLPEGASISAIEVTV